MFYSVCEQRKKEKTIYMKTWDKDTKPQEKDRLEMEAQEIKVSSLSFKSDFLNV